MLVKHLSLVTITALCGVLVGTREGTWAPGFALWSSETQRLGEEVWDGGGGALLEMTQDQGLGWGKTQPRVVGAGVTFNAAFCAESL